MGGGRTDNQNVKGSHNNSTNSCNAGTSEESNLYSKFNDDDKICLQIDSQAEIYRKSIKWEELAPLRVGCNARTAVLLGGVVYVGGGFEGSTTNNHDSYCIDVYNLAIN